MSTIRFTGAARTWLECLPLGDGRLGAMIDGGVSSTTIHLNDATAWSGSPDSEFTEAVPDAAESAALLASARAAIAAGDPTSAEAPLKAMQTRYAQSFVPFGDIEIVVDTGDADAVLTRELDLRSGIHRSHQTPVSSTTFIDSEHSVLVHVIEPAMPVRLRLSSPLHGPGSSTPVPLSPDVATSALLLRLPSDVAPGHEPDLPGALWSPSPGEALEGAIAARVITHADHTVVLVTTATTFAGVGEVPTGSAADALQDAVTRLDAATQAGADRLLAASEANMRALLGSVELSFGDTPVVSDTSVRFAAARADARGALASDPNLAALLFEYGRYLLVSASRPDGMPANLQGLWNAELRPPWGSAYTVNINTQMNYWGAHVTRLSDRAEALTSFTRALSEKAAAQTARLYGAPGWTVHHNTDAWLYATAPGRGSGDTRWAFWPMGGPWLASLLTEAWEFGAVDDDHLRAVWPTLRGAAEFALSWHHDGGTSPATSPENAFLLADGSAGSLAETSTMDLALLRMLFEKVVLTGHALGIDDDAVLRGARARLDELPLMPAIAPEGTIVEWDAARVEEDPHHRHVSHLFGLFPGSEHWDLAHRKAAEKTLERRGDDSSGWSLVWKLAIWSRLGRAEKVADLLELFLRDAEDGSGPWAGGLYPNLFAAHPPFQIDANLGFVGALSEALLQSHDGIHLLPAVPTALSTGSVHGLVARPGIIVDIEWRDARLVAATLRARRPSAVGAHRVRWGGHTITVHVDAEHDTRLDARSFPTEEVHP